MFTHFMSEHFITIFGLFVAVVGIISGIAVKLHLNNKNENKQTHIQKGSMDTEIDHLKEKLEQFERHIEVLEEDMQNNHAEYDSVQKQIADIRERLARVEERTKK